MTQILGILNLTRDSFSDGGRYLDPAAAIGHALDMARDGAAIIDVGAESTHPDAENVSADDEISRLTPVVSALVARGLCVSVDTYKPAVMRRMIALGAAVINDVTGLRDSDAVAAMRDSAARVIVMHSRSPAARATDDPVAGLDDAADPMGEIVAWSARRLDQLESAGIRRERIIIDPGMGFFIGATPRPSLCVLRGVDRLSALGVPVCVCASRKSFIGAVLERPVAERSPGTLAAELWAALRGVQYIRTHDVRPLHDALRMLMAIEAGR